MTINHVEFANFLCHFGNDKVLLDYLTEIVMPAFTDDTLIRKRGRERVAEYFFYDVEVHQLGKVREDSIVGITGDFVKNTSLIRTQIFDSEEGLVQDRRSIRSSPSSTFLLVLNSHTLAFLPRTPDAPTVGEFTSTVRSFLLKKHIAYIDDLYQSARDAGESATKVALRAQIPAPELHIVPLSSHESISTFVNRFSRLKAIDFRLLRPNPAISANEAFRDMRGVLTSLGANNGKLTASNNPTGLHKSVAADVIANATIGGNESVTLRGTDRHGAVLTGSNDDFKMHVPLESVPTTRRGLIRALFGVTMDVLPHAARSAADENAEGQMRLNQVASNL